jgi:hypothetical protein
VEDDGLAGLDHLERWAAEARAREAAEARVRERWLRTQAEEAARLGLVLAGLAERRADVVVTTISGRSVHGRLTGVGQDFLVIERAGTTLVALHAVAWVREPPGRGARIAPATGPDEELDAEDGHPPDIGREGVGPGAALASVLAQAVAHRPRVTIVADAAALTGELRTVGLDALVLRTPGDPPSLAYVRLRSVYEISFLDSG